MTESRPAAGRPSAEQVGWFCRRLTAPDVETIRACCADAGEPLTDADLEFCGHATQDCLAWGYDERLRVLGVSEARAYALAGAAAAVRAARRLWASRAGGVPVPIPNPG